MCKTQLVWKLYCYHNKVRKSQIHFQLPVSVFYALSHYNIWFISPSACHAQILLHGQAAQFMCCLAVLRKKETAGGVKSMSNTMTCTFLTLSLTKPQRISTALSQVVYLNKQTLINTLLEQITLQNKLHAKLSAKHSLLAELLTRTFCKTYIEKHDNRL